MMIEAVDYLLANFADVCYTIEEILDHLANHIATITSWNTLTRSNRFAVVL